MRERFILLFRVIFAIVALGAALSGRTPPAHAQVPSGSITSGEGSLLQYKIDVNKDAVTDLRAQVVILTAAQNKQAEEQARLDTKISLFFSILSVLSTGGIVLQFQRKKAPP